MKKWCKSTISALLLLLSPASFAQVDEFKPSLPYNEIVLPNIESSYGVAVQRVTARLTQSHYKKVDLSKSFLSAVFTRYLNFLDFNHSIFLQNDVDMLRELASHEMERSLYTGDLSLAYKAYQLMIERSYQQYSYLLAQLNSKPDLTSNGYIEMDRSKRDVWPKNKRELELLWQQRFKNDVISEKLRDRDWADIQKRLARRYDLAIKRLGQTRSDDIVQYFLNALAREIDPHTSYLSPRDAQKFQESISLSLEGIGATLSSEDGETIIRSLVPGAPAEKTNQLSLGDKIVGIGQSATQIEDVVGWRLDDVIDKIKGKKGTTVWLEIEPEKGGKTKIVAIVRDKIKLEDQAAKLDISDVNGYKVATITLKTFYSGLTNDVSNLIRNAKEKKVDGIIFDLRNNGGGLLTEAIDLSSLFIDSGPIVQVRDAFNRIKVYNDTENQLTYTGPVVIMINRYSASASEIFAAAMQDYNRAIIVGQQSFGKGTVQQSRPLNFINDKIASSLGIIQYTIQKFYRVNGGSTQIQGVKPDISYPSTIDVNFIGEESEDNALPWDSIDELAFNKQASLDKIIEELKIRHDARIKNDDEFNDLQEEVLIQEKRNNRVRLSLNLEIRRSENEQDRERRLKIINRRLSSDRKPLLENLDQLPDDYEAPDFLKTETEFIMIDYIRLLNDKKF